jgi:DNA-binding GntR family transcriptional regulator
MWLNGTGSMLTTRCYLKLTNRQFHGQLHLSARNSFLSGILESMLLSHYLLVGTTLSDPERSRQSFDEHAVLVRGLREHDPDAAEAAARALVRYAFKWRITQGLPLGLAPAAAML